MAAGGLLPHTRGTRGGAPIVEPRPQRVALTLAQVRPHVSGVRAGAVGSGNQSFIVQLVIQLHHVSMLRGDLPMVVEVDLSGFSHF